jgi:hypothetical protein
LEVHVHALGITFSSLDGVLKKGTAFATPESEVKHILRERRDYPIGGLMHVANKLRNTTSMMLMNSLVALAVASGLPACAANAGAEPSDPEQEELGSVQSAMFSTPGSPSPSDDGLAACVYQCNLTFLRDALRACGPILMEPKEQKECERPATTGLQNCTRACRSQYPHTPPPTTPGSQ